jgi:hypothetical protein
MGWGVRRWVWQKLSIVLSDEGIVNIVILWMSRGNAIRKSGRVVVVFHNC